MPTLRLLPVAIVVAAAASAAEPAGRILDPPRAVRTVLESRCISCHEGPEADGGLDIAALRFDPEDPQGDARWTRIIERVEAGEMPPPEEAKFADAGRRAFVKAAGTWLRQAIRDRDETFGRVRARRLSPRELERSLHALLGIDIPLADLIPVEGRPGGFTTVAQRQTMSHHQVERHLAVVDAALDEAFRRALQTPDVFDKEFDAQGVSRTDPKARTREPEMLDGRAVVWMSGVTYYGRIPATTAPADGWYRFRLRVAGLNPPETGGVWSTVHTGLCVSSAPLLTYVTAFEAAAEPREIEFEAWLPRRHMLEIRPGDVTLKKGQFADGQVGAGEGTPQNVPGIAIERLTMSRFHRGPDDGAVRRLLFGDVPTEAREKGGFRPRPRAAPADLERLIRDFGRRAFRRPVEPADLDAVVSLARSVQEAGGPFDAALRAGYRAILCSPRFIYLTEPAGRLDDHAIAARLSYFLTGGPPDAALATLADAGTLHDPAVLEAQADRLLGIAGDDADRAATRRFVTDFAAEWLDLDQIDFTEPDPKLFRDFDPIVKHSMLAETHAFLEEMLRENRSASWLISADATYLDSRLARYYGVPGVSGDGPRRVKLPAGTHRGGVITQGAVLKVTANGNNTSPVVRGSWVSERLLGLPNHPPPSGVPAIEPDIRGAKTVREQLAQHRSDSACASCHRLFDPIGFALENFDPAGRWRAQYLAIVDGKVTKGQKIDAGDVLANGRAFKDFDAFRTLAAGEADLLARAVAGQLLAYGTGAALSYADRKAVDEIAAAARTGHGLRSIVHAVVTHPVFLSK
ncbi:MAG: DUF1592 domain-containing protein [Planctomycetia bacterium]|nr:DUF1592 domain-containing protein [Planctomycetia bacterium]